MAILKLKTIADPVLYQKSEPVTEFDSELRELVRDMFETMYKEHGVGLAAVQVGVLKRVLVIDLVEAGFVKGVFINPEVVSTSQQTQTGDEGCLSIPGLVAPLCRPKEVEVRYQDIFGETKTIKGKDLMARALLHEMDHLDGKVFIDLLQPADRNKVSHEIELIQSGKRLPTESEPDYRRK